MVIPCTNQGSILVCAFFVLFNGDVSKMPKKQMKPEVNPFEGVVNQVVNPDGSVVPVQYIADPTAVFTLSAEHYAEIVDLADDWFNGCELMGKGKTLRSDSAKTIKKMLGENPTYPQYMAYRQAFINQLLSSGKTKNDTSAGQMWLELIGLVKDICKPFAIPSSKGKSAVRMASKRDKAKAQIEQMSDEILESAMADWKATDDFMHAQLAKAELNRRAKKALDTNPEYQKALEQLKTKRDSIIADIRKIKQLGDLEQIEALIMPFVPKSA